MSLLVTSSATAQAGVYAAFCCSLAHSCLFLLVCFVAVVCQQNDEKGHRRVVPLHISPAAKSFLRRFCCCSPRRKRVECSEEAAPPSAGERCRATRCGFQTVSAFAAPKCGPSRDICLSALLLTLIVFVLSPPLFSAAERNIALLAWLETAFIFADPPAAICCLRACSPMPRCSAVRALSSRNASTRVR